MKHFYVLTVFLFLLSGIDRNDPKPPGKLLDIGGYRLHINVKGKGSPAVVMIAGSQAFSFDWSLVFPEISRITRTCVYDRPSLAWSDAGPSPRTLDQDVYELHTLLNNAKIKPPYILVGHSLGGIIARKFEKKYTEEVKGLVLVDPTSEDALLFINNKVNRLRLLSQNRQIPGIKTQIDSFTKVPTQKDMDEFLKMVGQPKIEPPFNKLPAKFQQARLWAMLQPKFLMADNGDYWAEEFAAMYADSVYSLGDKPLFIITSGKNNYPREVGDSLRNDIMNQKMQQQKRMASLSSNKKHIITYSSGHEIHLEQPLLVIDAIKEVIRSLKTGDRLQ